MFFREQPPEPVVGEPPVSLPAATDPDIAPLTTPPPTSLGWRFVHPRPRAMPSWRAVAAGATQPTSIALEASALAAATYGGFVCINSNDPVSPAVAVPVQLTVTP